MNISKGATEEILVLREKLAKVVLPPELRQRVERALNRLARMETASSFLLEYDLLSRYVDWVTSLPWSEESQDNLDLAAALKILEKNHYGMKKIKDRILEYISVLALTAGQKTKQHASVLCFIGLPGLGKTSVASSIAEALGRVFVRIPMGGLGEVSQLRGLPRYLPSAEPGQVVRGLCRAGFRNPVLLFDEIDRVAEEGRSAVMGALLEILDPEQNSAFTDYFIDFPFDLSETLFLCSANNTRGIANAVMDRLEIIEMPAYTDEEKMVIGRDYILPKALEEYGLKKGQLEIGGDLWPRIIRPLGYDAGIRTLNRTIQGICRKVARKIVESGQKEQKFVLTEESIKDFLPTW